VGKDFTRILCLGCWQPLYIEAPSLGPFAAVVLSRAILAAREEGEFVFVRARRVRPVRFSVAAPDGCPPTAASDTATAGRNREAAGCTIDGCREPKTETLDPGLLCQGVWKWPRRVVGFYNQRGTAEQWINEGKQAVKRRRASQSCPWNSLEGQGLPVLVFCGSAKAERFRPPAATWPGARSDIVLKLLHAAKELNAPPLPRGRGSAKVLSRAREQAAGLMPKNL